jgi:membrane associated rhomboid family serine protease
MPEAAHTIREEIHGGSLVMGALPRFGSQVSWDGHLCGAVAGGLVAYALTRASRAERSLAQ